MKSGRNKKKILFVLVDGIGDVSVSSLSNSTPLQAARTPFLDAIAAGGLNGLMDPVEPGVACGSDTAHLSILGYDPRRYYKGRGAFESLGAGISMDPGDIAFKCNFAHMNLETGVVTHRRADRTFEEAGTRLCADLNGISLPSFPELEVRVKYATEHRCAIVLHGQGLMDSISGTDPLKDGLPLCKASPLDGTEEAHLSASATNELSDRICEILKNHSVNRRRKKAGKLEANIVLLRGCGSRLDVPTFEALHGLRSCVVAPTKIIAGLAMTLGMDVLVAQGGTGSYDTALHAKAAEICKALNNTYDFGFLHIKAVDDAGHDKNLSLKVTFLEAVDQMFGQIVKRLWYNHQATHDEYSVVCTGDHSTPVVFGDHSHEPVPFVIADVIQVVNVLGGPSKVEDISLLEIINPDCDSLPSTSSLRSQADRQKQVRRERRQGLETEQRDFVTSFDEISAASGALGRFCGSQVMSILKQFQL